MNKEILWNIVNSLLAGALVFLGALTNDGITLKAVGVAGVAALIVAVVQFKKYWEAEEGEYSTKKTLGSFIV